MRTSTRAPLALAMLVTVTATATVTACAPTTTDDTTDTSSASSCPPTLERLISSEAADEEIVLAIDQSLSFWDSPEAQERIRRQTQTVVTRAVTEGTALRVITFWGGTSDAGTVVACPSMAARFNNPAAQAQKTNHLAQQAADAVWNAVVEAERAPRLGTSVIGGWQATADATSQVPDTAARHAIMLSDGEGIPNENGLTVDLGMFTTAEMYDIGAVTRPVKNTTAQTNTLKAFWKNCLTSAGIDNPVVSSQTTT